MRLALPGRYMRKLRLRREGGFTLFELLLIVLVIAIVTVIGLPALMQQVHKNRMTGFGRELATQLRAGRIESIREHNPVVARLDLTTGELITFVDVHGALIDDDPDGIFNPIAGEDFKDTDYELARTDIFGVLTWAAPASQQVIDGFTLVDSERVCILDPDGSARDAGAFRYTDPFGNFMEVTVNPAPSGRVRVRKYNSELDLWLEDGENDVRWVWSNQTP